MVASEVRDSTVALEIRDSTVASEVRDSTFASEVRNSTVDSEIRDSTVASEVRDSTFASEIRDLTVGLQFRRLAAVLHSGWRALSRLSCRDSTVRGVSERRNGASEPAGEARGTFGWVERGRSDPLFRRQGASHRGDTA